MKKEKDIRQLVMLTKEPQSGMGAIYKKGLFHKFFVILKENNIEIGELSEMTDGCSMPCCYEHKEEK